MSVQMGGSEMPMLCLSCVVDWLEPCSVEQRSGFTAQPVLLFMYQTCAILSAKDGLSYLDGTLSFVPFWGFKSPAQPSQRQTLAR